MFLKSLSIQGFKSFANRVTIELPRGVAAVVGPNGSGKSNIADALRWVLGEQSIRLLRGVRLEDVIFAGSDAKRAVGLAEVSITFDNASGRIPLEYAEVTATRRVYRSGESEFLINKAPCRLRDIQELFMDTGIGRGSLSIIGQGEVEAILSARPEDRRAFLEEAAGITRYQARKDEAIRRLVRAQEDLVRVQDIIREVERQLGPLEIQAQKAEEYQHLSERLLRIEVGLLLEERRRATVKRDGVVRSCEQVDRRRDEVRGEMQEIETQVQALTQSIEELDREIDDRKAREDRARELEVEARHRAEMARERLQRYDAEEEERKRRIVHLNEVLENTTRAEAEAQRALKGGVAAAKDTEEALQSASSALAKLREGIGESGESLKSAQDRLSALSEHIAAAHSRSEAYDREIAAFAEQRSELLARRDALTSAVQAAEAQKVAKEQSLAQFDSAFARSHNEREQIKSAIAGLRTDRNAKEKELAAERRAAQDLAARKKALAEMEEAREGYHRGVRAVLETDRERKWGLIGAVAELIEAPERLEAAIEVALGSAQQFVVAKSDQSAKLAIEYLKERRLGRATFLPIESLRPTPLRGDARARLADFPGVVGVASDLVTAPKECEPVVEYLLGRVVVTDTLDAALLVSKRVQGINRIVTIEGDVVTPGGAITGGSRSHRSEGLLGRRRQIDALAMSLKSTEEKVAAIEKAIALLDDEARKLVDRASALEEERRTLEIEKLSCERDVKDAHAEVARLKASLTECEKALERLGAKEETLKREVQSASSQIAVMIEDREALRARVAQYEQAMAGNREKEEALRNEVERLKVSLAEIGRENEQRRREIERLQKETVQVRQSVAEEEEALRSINTGRNEATLQIERATAAAQSAEKERTELQAQVSELHVQKSALRDKTQALSESAAKARTALEELQEQATRLAIERERVESELARIDEQLEARGFSDGEESATFNVDDEQAMRSEARTLKKRINELGVINPGSIEEYREARERYEFLTAQRDDLEEAKADLTEVIARIDRESVKKLQSVYDELKTAFSDMFRRLFGGGQASLAFTDPDNPLESGLEIFVQPPGKKLQNLMALSGGEKALAAIALLFGILTVRPSPFCVLDEIDAPLDEHNLVRFRSILEEFSHNTQFLIITHRQPTMETADCLYGVTMEESGVSTLVSLKLGDVKSA